MVAKGEMIVKRIKILTLIICFVLLLAAIFPMTKIEKTDLIAQVCIFGYRSEDYILQITDNGAIFAFRGKPAFGPHTTDDGEFWFEEIFEAKSRRLTRGEYQKIIELIEEIKTATRIESGGIVEKSPGLGVFIGDDKYNCPYWLAWPEDEKLQRLAYNLVLMSPIKSGPEDFNEDIMKVADRAINGYIDEDGEKIDPITWRK